MFLRDGSCLINHDQDFEDKIQFVTEIRLSTDSGNTNAIQIPEPKWTLLVNETCLNKSKLVWLKASETHSWVLEIWRIINILPKRKCWSHLVNQRNSYVDKFEQCQHKPKRSNNFGGAPGKPVVPAGAALRCWSKRLPEGLPGGSRPPLDPQGVKIYQILI